MTAVLDLDITDPQHTARVAHALADLLVAGDLLILTGELGAGKTTFTRSLGEGLGVREGVISPTFVLSRVHPNLPEGKRPGGPDLVHVDAYRLTSPDEIDDLDLEYSQDTSVTVVEWGQGKVEHLSDSYLNLELTRPTGDLTDVSSPDAFADLDEEEPAEARQLRISATGTRWEGVTWDALVQAVKATVH
ncbi:tRNA (adenosine(37)-N6)-threonylcarbamoyltransferase complex ATPase subunit type 1 TsaE [Rothia sp. ZJ1223]|uniref:tRNA (adenosine(37)-N6)-threonylcarbamoyltransferase complex ATPase subunit type 1 TsaE n=1 Tax=Rothia sp. ZJ1223 TaxID=2811098 RepID=UPI00195AD7E5|nr:tRNA (adenosine(37)-N6)-threonylcarbamoyltransferase complex ATPase subunit type 1 TsaE [Rothia sp. ZJ1223]MBM7051183.1 tRNA (adenosine(37)-N6)-threonylcarbamoyltransferase complex ATPase subunit type 1 TsaE [Rothia sp. ZJ1223]